MHMVCEMKMKVVMMWVHSVGTKDNKKRNGGNNRFMPRNWRQKDNKSAGRKATAGGGTRRKMESGEYVVCP